MRPNLFLLALLLAPAAAHGAPMEFDSTILDGSFDGALGIETGDLDHDGVPDLVSTAYNGDQVKIWLSPTPGSFASTAVVSVGQNPGWPRLRDIDRDGDLDIFVGSFGSDELVWLENDGSGGTWGSHTISTDQNPWAIELGDVDGDGDEDLVVGSYGDGSQDVRWYENLDGVGGSWGSAVSISSSAFEAWHLILVDFDKDGHLDVVATDEDAEEIRWWLNDGDASGWTSTSALSFPSTSYPQTVKVFDMDRDGDLDIVCSFSQADELNWYENDGSLGTWTEHAVAALDGGQENELVDLDLDGDVDIVGTAMAQSDVMFFEALDGSGDSWSADTIEGNLGTPMRVAPFDWEQDGDLDLAVTGWFADDVRVYQNLSLHGTTWDWSFGGLTGGSNARVTEVVDFDGDGDLDFFGSGSNDIYLCINDGTGSFVTHTLTAGTASYWALAAGDVDGDGDIDVAAISNNAQEVLWLENDGSLAGWPVIPVYDTGGTTFGRDIELADLDGDGDLDIVSGDAGRDDLIVHLNDNGVGITWTQVVLDAGYNNVEAVEVVDFDRDGDLDVVACAMNESTVGIWYGDGSGTAWSYQSTAAIGNCREVRVVDMDFDGDHDIVATDGTNGNVLLFSNGGDDVTFLQSALGSGLTQAIHAIPVDLDKDGDYDIVASGYDEVVAIFQDGGSWGTPVRLRNGNTVVDGAVGDFDLDGDIDVLYPDIGSDDWWLTLNEWANGRSTVEDQSPADPSPGATGVLLSSLTLDAGHRAGEGDMTLGGTLTFLFEDLAGTALTQTEVEAVFAGIDVWLDDGDGVFNAANDTLDASLSSFPVANGAVDLTIADADLAAYAEQVLWITADIGSDASLMTVQDIYIGVSFAGTAEDFYGRSLTVLGIDDDTYLGVDAGSVPVAVLDGPYTADEGDSVLVDGTGSTDSDGNISTYEFDCDGDGVFEVSQVTTGTFCLWTDDGTYTVSLRVTDTYGNTSTTTTTATVANVTPTLTVTGATSTNEGVSESYSVTVTDPGDDTVSGWSWTVADANEATIDTATVASPTFTFPDDGTYTLDLEVTDEDGTHLTSVTVTVANVAPTVSMSGNTATSEGTAETWTATVSDVAADTVTVSWELTLLGVANPAVTATGTTVSITAPDDGVYILTATASDEDGGSASVVTPVVVSNVAPTVAISGASAAVEGVAASYSVTVTDPGDDTVSAWAWSVQDAGGAVVDTSSSASPSFAFADDGAYTVSVDVTDEDGTWSDSFAVTVSNAAPTVTASGPSTASEGTSETYTASTSDVAADTVTVTWTLLDPNGASFATATGDSVSLTFGDDGTYTVVATATDEDGATSTDSLSVVVGNVAPTISAAGNAAPAEGSAESWLATVNDVAGDTVTVTWELTELGASSPAMTATGTAVSITAPDDGLFLLTATATDEDGGSSSSTHPLIVSNVAPTVAISGASVAEEGVAESYSVTVTDPGDDTVNAWSWTVQDAGGGVVDSSSSASPSLTFPDDGAYTVLVDVVDEDGTWSDSFAVTVSNVDPTVVVAGAATAAEGGSETYTATTSDVATDTVTVSWELQDAGGTVVDTATGASATFTFPADGDYSVVATATDEDGGSASDSVAVSVSNGDPTVEITGGAGAMDEGSTETFTATASDPGGDTVTVTWEFSLAGTVVDTATGLSVTFTPTDEGTYDVVVTADDGDGGTATDTETITVSNVAPTIDSTATTTVTEGSSWSYEPTVTEPGSDVLTWTTNGAPAAMTAPTSTGAIEWVPAYADVGDHTFTLDVSDGDGGSDSETITITVSYLDADADGMPDTWETANSLDPTVDDSALDPDADGITNLDEWLDGTDPQVYDGPSAPVATSPVFGAEVATATPVLTWDNAEDPDEDVLTYDVEVWADATLSVLLDSTTALAEDASGSTTWTPSVGPAENAVGYWRVRASDPYVDGPWTNLEYFTVNALEEAPGVPVASAPLTGDSVSSTTPTLSWLAPTDPDGDAVTYDVTIWDVAGTTVIEDVVGIGALSWAPVNPLSEDTTYLWEVQAVDDTGLASGWSAAEEFFVDTSNNPPSDSAWVSPLEGDAIEPTSPTLEVTPSVDPEGGAVTYQWELDLVSTFDSGDLVTGSTSAETWDLSADSVALTDNVDWHARVRTQDGGGAASTWQTVMFFVRGPNDAPGAPSLVAPVDEALYGPDEPTPTLVAGHVTDVEGDPVTYGFVLARDEALTDVVTSVADLDAGAGPQGTADQTSWTPDEEDLAAGVYYWAAIATDDGGASATSEVWSFEVEEPAGDDDDSAGDDDDSAGDDDDSVGDDDDSVGDDDDSVGDDDDSSDGGPTGCDCESSVAGSGAKTGGTLSILFLLAFVRRRRRTPAGPLAP